MNRPLVLSPRIPILVAGLALAACPEPGDTGDQPAEPDDTNVDTDDSDPSEDTGETGETGDTGEPEGTPVSFAIEGGASVEGASLTLVAMSMSKSGVTFGQSLLTRSLEADTREFSLPAPESAWIGPVFEDWLGEQQGAWFLAFLFIDADQDLERDADEIFGGLSLTSLIYLEKPLREEAKMAGLTTGWNALQLDFQGGTPAQAIELDTVTLSTSILPTESLDVDGTWYGGSDTSGYRVAIAPPKTVQAEGEGTPFHDVPLELNDGRWSVTLAGSPPREHFDTTLEFPLANELPFAYADDGDGQFSDGDTVAAFLCSEGRACLLTYGAGHDSPERAFNASISEAPRPGWALLTGYPEQLVPLDGEALSNLILSPACISYQQLSDAR
jgi:hypothetical protein